MAPSSDGNPEKPPGGCGGFDHSRYRRHEDVASESVGDELLLVQLATGATFRLNETGRSVWELAVAGHTGLEIIEQLAVRFDIPRSRIEQDVEDVLGELVESALLEPAVAGTSELWRADSTNA